MEYIKKAGSLQKKYLTFFFCFIYLFIFKHEDGFAIINPILIQYRNVFLFNRPSIMLFKFRHVTKKSTEEFTP